MFYGGCGYEGFRIQSIFVGVITGYHSGLQRRAIPVYGGNGNGDGRCGVGDFNTSAGGPDPYLVWNG